MDLQLDSRDASPLYLQIAQAIRRQVAGGTLPPGSALPTVRDLAQRLGVNQNTVLRAYGMLREEGVLEGRASLGTRVSPHAVAETVQAAREAELRLLASRFVVEALSRGFSLGEVEAAFVGQRGRWAEQAPGGAAAASSQRILGLGSHDLCLELLLTRFRQLHPGRAVTFASVGSLAGLLALARGEVHFAGAHLYDAAAGDYNGPALRELAPGRAFDLITLAHRTQGLLVARGNPKRIEEITNLAQPGVRFVNRQRGAGTRLLLDQLLQSSGLDGSSVAGYTQEAPTHVAVAAAIASGAADAGLGIQAAATAFDLDFVPLARERYELALSRGDALAPLLQEAIAIPDFRQAAEALGGYDLSESGTLRQVT